MDVDLVRLCQFRGTSLEGYLQREDSNQSNQVCSTKALPERNPEIPRVDPGRLFRFVDPPVLQACNPNPKSNRVVLMMCLPKSTVGT